MEEMGTQELFKAPVGKAVTRVDGHRKVTGAAQYALDHTLENVAYAAGVFSTIGKGRITRIDTSAAMRMPGVMTVLTHENTHDIYRAAERLEPGSHAGENRAPLSDDKIYYYGQFVAVVVAHTLEQAEEATHHVKVSYDAEKPDVMPAEMPLPSGEGRAHYSRGNAASAYASAPVQIEGYYSTPTQTHNQMEMHATIAHWNGDRVTLYETTQQVVSHHNTSAEILGLPLDHVEIVSPFCGGGFGGKLFPWPQSALAAVAARRVKRPVKLMVPRHMMFTTVGHRPITQQHLKIGAGKDGKLLSIDHNVVQPTSKLVTYMEYCIGVTGMAYSCASVNANQHLVEMDIGSPTPTRGPGAVPGLYALESAMDDLAIQLNMDPLALRLKNYAEKDESSNKPFSGKHLRECYEAGAKKFGWSKRNPKVGSMRDGDEILGWGMATCIWDAGRQPAEVRVLLQADGTARVSSATQDPGTGTYTIMAQVAAERLGIPIDKVDVVIGYSNLPPGPGSGGSTATASIIPAVAKATDNAMQAMVRAAAHGSNLPFGQDAKLEFTGGYVHAEGGAPESGMRFEKLLSTLRLAGLDGRASTQPDHEEFNKYSRHCFGAQFVEVGYDPGIARLRARRIVSVMDVGRVINQKTARNQVLGGVVWGLGQGMFEETIYVPENAKPINNNLADYLVATNADVPETDVIFVEYPDYHINEFGARGVGEIGMTGVASALTMAVHHATGVRVRQLPIRIEQLLQSKLENA